MSLSVGERIENREAGTCSGCHKARDVGSGTLVSPLPAPTWRGGRGRDFRESRVRMLLPLRPEARAALLKCFQQEALRKRWKPPPTRT